MATETVKYIFDAQTGQFIKDVNSANASAKALDNRMTQTGENIRNFGARFSIVSAIVAVGLRQAVVGASDLAEANNKVDVAFGESANSIKKFAKNANAELGETEAKVLDTAAQFRLIGVEAGKIPEFLTRIADVASLQNKSFSQVADDFTSALNGSSEVVEKYGIKIKELDLKQFAFEKGLASSEKEAGKFVQSLNSAEKQALIYSKIMNDTAVAQGDFANNTKEFAVSSRIALASLKDLGTEMIGYLMPIFNDMVLNMTALIKRFRELPIPIKKALAILTTLVAVLGPLLVVIGQLVIWGSKIAPIFTAIKGAIASVSAPTLLIVAGIVALVGVLIYAWKTSEKFRDALGKAFKEVKAVVMPILATLVSIFVDDLLPVFQDFVEYVKGQMPQATTFLTNVFNNYLTPALKGLGDFINKWVLPAVKEMGRYFSEELVPRLKKVWAYLQENLLPVLSDIGTFIETDVLPALSDLWTWIEINILPALSDFVIYVKDNVLVALDEIGKFIVTKVIPALSDLWTWIEINILPVLVDFKDFFINELVPALGELWKAIQTYIIPALDWLWNILVTYVLPSLGDLWDILREIADFVAPILIPVLQILGGILGGALLLAIGFVTGAINTLGDALGFIKDSIDFVKDRFNEMKENLSRLKQVTLDLAEVFLNFTLGNFGSLISGIKDTIDSVIGSVIDLTSKISGIDVGGVLDKLGQLNPLFSVQASSVNGVPTQGGQSTINNYNFSVSQTGQLDRSSIEMLKGRALIS